MTASNKEDLDLEANSAYTISECTDEPLIDRSLCTERSLSSIPIEEDVELTGLTKTTESKKATAKQFSITQGKQSSHKTNIHPKVTCFDLSVKGKHNNKMSVDIYTPKGQYWGTSNGTGSIGCCIHHRNGSKYVPQGWWKLAVSGDEVSSIKAFEHH
jgi:hypothetical protein